MGSFSGGSRSDFLELHSTPTPLQKMELDPVQAPILATGASSDPVPLQLRIKQSSLLFCSLYVINVSFICGANPDFLKLVLVLIGKALI